MTEIIITTKEELDAVVSKSVRLAMEQTGVKTDSKEERTDPYTKIELKNLLKVSMPTIDRWSKRGILERIVIGSRVYFSAKSVHLLLKRKA